MRDNNRGWTFFTEESVIMDYEFVFWPEVMVLS